MKLKLKGLEMIFCSLCKLFYVGGWKFDQLYQKFAEKSPRNDFELCEKTQKKTLKIFFSKKNCLISLFFKSESWDEFHELFFFQMTELCGRQESLMSNVSCKIQKCLSKCHVPGIQFSLFINWAFSSGSTSLSSIDVWSFFRRWMLDKYFKTRTRNFDKSTRNLYELFWECSLNNWSFYWSWK